MSDTFSTRITRTRFAASLSSRIVVSNRRALKTRRSPTEVRARQFSSRMSRDELADTTNEPVRTMSSAREARKASASSDDARVVDLTATVADAGLNNQTTTTAPDGARASAAATAKAEKARIKAEKARIKEEKERLKAAAKEEKEKERRAKEEEKRLARERKDAERRAKAEVKATEKAKLRAEKEAEAEKKLEAKRKEQQAREKQANAFAKFFTPKTKTKPAVEPTSTTPLADEDVRTKLDEIVRADGEAEDIGRIRTDLFKRWKAQKGRGMRHRWGARRVEREVKVVSMLCFPVSKKRKRDRDESTATGARKRRLFDIDVDLFARPAFWGTGPFPNRPAVPSVVSGRKPFEREMDVDYEYDSAEEWEEEEKGESLSDADNDEDEDMAQVSDEDDGFIAVDDELTADVSNFDPAAIGDDADMAQKRSTIAMLASRSRRGAQGPVVISSLQTTSSMVQYSEDPALLRVFSAQVVFRDAPRIGLVASTSQPLPAVKSKGPKSATKMSADNVVQANLRMLIEFLLVHPELKVNQAKTKFVEEACHTVAGLNQSAVKRAIESVATHTSGRWVITSQAVESVGLTAAEIDDLRSKATVSVKPAKTTVKRRKSNEVSELPKGTDSPLWNQALQSIVTSKDKERKISPQYEALFHADTVKTLIQRSVVPDYYVSFLIKAVCAKNAKDSFLSGCKLLLITVLSELATGTMSEERRLVLPARASVEGACAGDALRKAISACIDTGDAECALEIMEALIPNEFGLAFVKSMISSTETMRMLTSALSECDDLSKTTVRVLRDGLGDEAAIETCSAFHPTEFCALSEKLAANILSSSTKHVQQNVTHVMRGLHVLRRFIVSAPENIDVDAVRATLVTILEGCVVSREEKDVNSWQVIISAILNIFSEQAVISSLQLGNDDVARIRNVLVELGKSTDARVAQLAQMCQQIVENV